MIHDARAVRRSPAMPGRADGPHLIHHTGSTTVLLERTLRTPLTVRVLHQGTRSAQGLPDSLRGLLRLAPPGRAIVRRSELVMPDGTPVSRNTVVSDALTPSEIARALTDPSTPIGRSGAVRGRHQERSLVSFGHSTWDGAGRSPAMWRGYLIRLHGAPAIYVEEHFNPDLVPAS